MDGIDRREADAPLSRAYCLLPTAIGSVLSFSRLFRRWHGFELRQAQSIRLPRIAEEHAPSSLLDDEGKAREDIPPQKERYGHDRRLGFKNAEHERRCERIEGEHHVRGSGRHLAADPVLGWPSGRLATEMPSRCSRRLASSGRRTVRSAPVSTSNGTSSGRAALGNSKNA